MVVVSSTINIRDQQWDFEGNSHVFVVCRFFVLSSSLFGHFWINHGPLDHFLEFFGTDFESSGITFMSRVQVN